jgi:L-asparagine transporter-like permease
MVIAIMVFLIIGSWVVAWNISHQTKKISARIDELLKKLDER